MGAETVEIKVARLEAQVGALRADVTEIKADTKDQNGKLDQLVAVHNQRKGAQAFAKAMMGIGSGSGFLAAVAWLVEHLKP